MHLIFEVNNATIKPSKSNTSALYNVKVNILLLHWDNKQCNSCSSLSHNQPTKKINCHSECQRHAVDKAPLPHFPSNHFYRCKSHIDWSILRVALERKLSIYYRLKQENEGIANDRIDLEFVPFNEQFHICKLFKLDRFPNSRGDCTSK